MTHSGDVLGTPGYLAPEHLAGRPGDRRADVYALGVTLYECLTRRLPFEAPTREALVVRILQDPAPDPRAWNPAIGRDLVAVLETALAKNPDRRYATARALADDLAALAAGGAVSVRRAGPAARAWQWARRHRTAAALIAVAAVVVPILAGLGGYRRREASGHPVRREQAAGGGRRARADARVPRARRRGREEGGRRVRGSRARAIGSGSRRSPASSFPW